MNSHAYWQGYAEAARSLGVDPALLQKSAAITPEMYGAGAGALLGGGLGGYLGGWGGAGLGALGGGALGYGGVAGARGMGMLGDESPDASIPPPAALGPARVKEPDLDFTGMGGEQVPIPPGFAPIQESIARRQAAEGNSLRTQLEEHARVKALVAADAARRKEFQASEHAKAVNEGRTLIPVHQQMGRDEARKLQHLAEASARANAPMPIEMGAGLTMGMGHQTPMPDLSAFLAPNPMEGVMVNPGSPPLPRGGWDMFRTPFQFPEGAVPRLTFPPQEIRSR